ncbi:Rpn family recombination-promoting nuclease/putative transposase [Methanobrevibacter filiformis]|uniref:PD-(D/E)XK nuclease family transposase n=1 Tax=Methanobrevibacter filiformis TaxID=55758 RepID=A0A166DPI3_9EURY|nr:Rpn family recombination-promoting nuclease/putative transposase [Methanobrevibacter filiformis]KZX15822.1 PD-(D/E)XK nuclease family transposase [Methanobrevibacter filiformis]
MNNRLNPLNDALFLKYMGEKGMEIMLVSFLNAVLEKTRHKFTIDEIEIIENKTITPKVLKDKKSILDIRAKINGNITTNIEVQLLNLGNMGPRSLYYWSREFSLSLDEGEDYIELPKTITINLLNFNYIQLPLFHTSFHIREDTNNEYVLNNLLEMHFIEMPKFRKMPDKDLNNPLHRWLMFLDRNTDQKILDDVIEMDEAIGKAQERINYVSQDKEALRAYQMREMALSDMTTAMNTARREGKMEGLKEGKIEGKMEGLKEGEINLQRKHIINMKNKNMSLDEISEITGLSIDEIEKF